METEVLNQEDDTIVEQVMAPSLGENGMVTESESSAIATASLTA